MRDELANKLEREIARRNALLDNIDVKYGTNFEKNIEDSTVRRDGRVLAVTDAEYYETADLRNGYLEYIFSADARIIATSQEEPVTVQYNHWGVMAEVFAFKESESSPWQALAHREIFRTWVGYSQSHDILLSDHFEIRNLSRESRDVCGSTYAVYDWVDGPSKKESRVDRLRDLLVSNIFDNLGQIEEYMNEKN